MVNTVRSYSKLRNYPRKFGVRLVALWKRMTTEKRGMPILPAQRDSASEVFASLRYDDMWQEAQMASVCHYLRGGKSLAIPSHFRDLMPAAL